MYGYKKETKYEVVDNLSFTHKKKRQIN